MTVQLSTAGVKIESILINSPDVTEYFIKQEDLTKATIKALEVGCCVLNRVAASNDLDFVNKRIGEMLVGVDKHFETFDTAMHTILSSSLDPEQRTSFLYKAQQLIHSQSEKVQAGLTEVLKSTQDMFTRETSRLEQYQRQFDYKMNPVNSDGYTASVVKKIEDFDRSLNAQFSETDRASFVGKLQTLVGEYFGKDGEVLALIDQKLSLDDSKSPLAQVSSGLKLEISSLRDTLMRYLGQQELIEQTSAKGFVFEEIVFERLQEIARNNSDVAEDVSLKAESISGSKKGDYLYWLGGSLDNIVLDAKNYKKLNSLRAMLDYLNVAMLERNSKMGIIVVPDVKNMQKQIGEWNIYDGNKIITALPHLEISIKYAKYAIRLQDSDSQDINLRVVKDKLEIIQRKLKEITSVKSKLTKLSNGVEAAVQDIQQTLDNIREDITCHLTEIESEFRKSEAPSVIG